MDEKQKAYITMMWGYAKESGRDFTVEITAAGDITITIDRPTVSRSSYQQELAEEGKR